ncbi:prolyl oligopeptidase family serine peptidase [Duganella sp. FT80W]|uniref:Prolyl oligopeptidase family serine peptidase n=1 Tax=Duganella guangzhouensis TaxID=2666084 RepID=A0A6I2L259_9BURK|nr:alpha/beta fold hydrolase [Duganella guangzhouensis]MRW92405.1 prolyl oligopeptidase family serine peptidase [Duganella guangzhouensis]
MRLTSLLRALALAGAFLGTQALAAEAAKTKPAIASFFENPEFSDAELSPSGRYLAVRLGSKDRRDMLGVVDLTTNAVKAVGNFSDADIGQYAWVNDNRLVFTATDKDLAPGDMRYAPGLYAINRDGTGFRQLAMRSGKPFVTNGSTLTSRELLPWHTYLTGQDGAQDSDYIYVQDRNYSSAGEFNYTNLLRLNTVNGRVASSVDRPGDSYYWLLDHNGEPRLTLTRDKATSMVWYRDPATKAWRKLTDFEAYTGRGGTFRPLAFGPDGTLYVLARNHSDTTEVYTYNLNTGKLADHPLVKLDGYDFRGELIMSKDKLLGIRHLTDAMGTTWLDEGMKAMQAKIDQMLPNTVNLINVPPRSETPWVLVTSYADFWPKRTMLYNSETGKLTLVGAAHPAIDPNQMARMDMVDYKTRDGLTIAAGLTLPQGANKNLPLVVLVHGGPWVRGSQWGWNAQAQFLASRGYAVLEPEYRGSTGYGSKLFHAGWKQWGLKMQDDVADATRWAIDKGIADPKRICIAGASYGGYATLMGLIRYPDLYKCGFEWAGVTDINLMYDGSWFYESDTPEDYKRYGMPVLIGDQVKDAEQLKATSPLLQASKITQPLLMGYGTADRRVPLPHGTRFYKAVKDTNPNVEWVEYEEEGHGWKLPKNRIDWWSRVEKFLDKNIGATP